MKKLALITALLLLCSCASRRKEVHSVKSGLTFNASVDTNFSFAEKLNYKLLANALYSRSQNNLFMEYDGQEGDSMSMEQYGPDGKLIGKTVFKGKGKGTLSNTNTEETAKQDVQASKTSEHSGTASGSIKINSEASHENLDKKVSTSLLPYLWWLLLFVAIALLWYFNKRYSWAKRLKTHVTAWFS